jgi:hypothetical protein
MIATTLNIHRDVLTQIKDTSILFDKAQREIIVLLLMRMMRNHYKFRKMFCTVKYQRKDVKTNWRCFHIKFREDENEFFVDMRKFCKISVSYLLAIAVNKYLDELIESFDKPVDNYHRFKDYVLLHEEVEGVFSWRIYWGFPYDHLNTLDL